MSRLYLDLGTEDQAKEGDIVRGLLLKPFRIAQIVSCACAISVTGWAGSNKSPLLSESELESGSESKIVALTLKEVKYHYLKLKLASQDQSQHAKIREQWSKFEISQPQLIRVGEDELGDLAGAGSSAAVKAKYEAKVEHAVQLGRDLDIENNLCHRAILAHELVHYVQYQIMKHYNPVLFERVQSGGSVGEDLYFALEREAYQVQYRWMRENKGNQPGQILDFMETDFSGQCFVVPGKAILAQAQW